MTWPEPEEDLKFIPIYSLKLFQNIHKYLYLLQLLLSTFHFNHIKKQFVIQKFSFEFHKRKKVSLKWNVKI